jgi:response regulator RpfG family c-di-GMP phosphodiesterase
MPGMTGCEAARKIRQMPEFDDIPVIAVSARAFEHDREHSIEAGCDDFLPKPVDVTQLLDMLKKYLQLEWIYEHPACDAVSETQPTAETGEKQYLLPPREELHMLFNLATIGDLQGIQKHAERLKQLETAFIPFADRLQKLAKGFEEKELVMLLKQYIEE